MDKKRGRLASFFSRLGILVLGVSGVYCPVFAVDSVRTQEINECRPNEIATWADGRDRSALASPLVFVFDPAGTPYWFSVREIELMIRRAAEAWSGCGIPGEVIGLQGSSNLPANSIRIQWHEKQSRGNFGLANLDQRTLSLAPSAFTLLRQRNPAHDARQTLQMVLSHEMGHFYGLMAHSRRCVDVLSYYSNEQGESCFSRDLTQLRSVPEYRHTLPTACDIERCQRANGFR
jgi:hypothetical protein